MRCSGFAGPYLNADRMVVKRFNVRLEQPDPSVFTAEELSKMCLKHGRIDCPPLPPHHDAP